MNETTAPFEVATHLAAIIESSDDAIVSKTLEGIVTSWNPGAQRIFGYNADEVIGKSIRIIIPRDRWSEEDDVLARVRRGERVDHFETVRRTKDGRMVNISLTVSPVKDQSGKIVGASKVARDITERKRSEAERERLLATEKESRRQAEQANRLKDEFLAVVSHELRSPLNAITGWASLLMMRPLDDQTKRAIETILRNAQTQTQLVADLLDVSRIVTGQLRLSVRSFQLIPIVEAAIEVVRPAADAKSIRIETALDSTAGPIAGDPDRMQQILWNLLSNAVKFTPRGGDIKVRMQRIGSHLEIVVSDTGKGIAPKLLPFIFERFRQGDSSTTREHGGLGLGLAIVRHLVELHGGVVSARSEGEDRGAEFTIQLPVLSRPKELGGAVTRHHVNEYGPGGTSLAGLRILLVDDEPDAREIVATILGEAGAEIATASNSRQALELIEQWSPDLLISDIGMPGESGYDLIRKVRALSNGNSGQIPAIALTAYARVEDRLKILSAGFQMHVPKPIEPIELVTVIASLTKRL